MRRDTAVAAPEGVHGFHGTPLLKGCLRNTMRKRTTYTTLTLKLRTSASTVAITHVSTPVSRIRRAHGLDAHISYQKQRATIETMSEESERIKAYSCIAPSASRDADMLSVHMRALIFPRLTRMTSCFAAPAAQSGVTLF